MDVDGNGSSEFLITAQDQHVYAIGARGNRVDDLRLSGLIIASPVAVSDRENGRTDVLVLTKAHLAHRLRPSMPRSPYRPVAQPKSIGLSFPDRGPVPVTPTVVIDNPHGALIRVAVTSTDKNSHQTIQGRITSRSLLELPLPEIAGNRLGRVRVTVHDSAGQLLIEKSQAIVRASGPPQHAPLTAWSTTAYGSFDDTRTDGGPNETALSTIELEQLGLEAGADVPDPRNTVVIAPLYVGEVDQGSFIVSGMRDQPIRARVTIEVPVRSDGDPFQGNIALHEVVLTGTINGERVADALPALGDSGLLTIPAQRSAKIWVSVDSSGARPGLYRGHIVVRPLLMEAEPLQLPLLIRVLTLRLPKAPPLSLCTWDYLPRRQWFRVRLDEVLDGMERHGVNVFPRGSCIPTASIDRQGHWSIDWRKLDIELDALKGRGQMLFQMSRPPVDFAVTPTDRDKRRLEIEYLHRFRDHLKQRDWNYEDYGFYPVDEPGLHKGKNVPSLVTAAELFREADSHFRVYTDPVNGLSWKDFARMDPLIDIWCPEMELVAGLLVDDPRMQRIMNSKKPVWSDETSRVF